MSNQTPYIGSKISLISKLDIRYEGILYTVDTNDSTIALAKVRSFGTEDRPSAQPVPARDDVYEYIIFKAQDIKDLIVCETPKVATLAGGLPYDPAIISVSTRSGPVPAEQRASNGSSRSGTPNRASPNFPAGGSRAPGAGRPARGRSGSDFSGEGRPMNQNRPQQFQQRGGFNSNRGGRGSFGGRYNQRDKLKFDGDYDFEKANEQFQETLTEKFTEVKIGEKSEDESPDKEAFYDKKSSFFDRISCEALEKAEGKNGRPNWRKERETNQETFGHSAVRSLNYRRGFGGPRGRGGRGGYNNYNRGGYNNGNNMYRGNYNNYRNKKFNNQNRDDTNTSEN